MKYKGYISKSYFDQTTWENHEVNSNLWERTKILDDSDFIIYIDNCESIDSNKYKILYLIESQDVLKKNYNDIIQKLKPNLIVSYNQNMVSEQVKIINTVPPFKSWITAPSIYKKNKLCSMICSMFSHTNLQKHRIEVYYKFQDKIDCYGKHTNYIQNKIDGLKDYCFSIAIENDIVPGYFTEKILDCFLTGTVPIYLGDPKIGKYFDERGIIFYNEAFDVEQLSFDRYQQMLPYIESNYNKAKTLKVSFDDYFLKGVDEYVRIRTN